MTLRDGIPAKFAIAASRANGGEEGLMKPDFTPRVSSGWRVFSINYSNIWAGRDELKLLEAQ